MNTRALIIGGALAVMAGTLITAAQAPPPASVNGLVSAAKEAAGLEWAGTFMRLCVVPPPARPRAAAAAAAAPARPPGKGRRGTPSPPRSRTTSTFSAPRSTAPGRSSAATASSCLEALFDYAAPDEIAGGMRKLGLDINKVKYVVISHAHADHDGGAQLSPGHDAVRASRLRRSRTGMPSIGRRTTPVANRSATRSAPTA